MPKAEIILVGQSTVKLELRLYLATQVLRTQALGPKVVKLELIPIRRSKYSGYNEKVYSVVRSHQADKNNCIFNYKTSQCTFI